MKTTIFILTAITVFLIYLAITNKSLILAVLAASTVSLVVVVLGLYFQKDKSEEFLREKIYTYEELADFMN